MNEEVEQFTHICQKHGEYKSTRAKPMHWKDCAHCVSEAKEFEQISQAKSAEERRLHCIKVNTDRSGIPERFLTKSFNDYEAKSKGQVSAFEFAKTYAEEFEEVRKTGRGAIFCGKPGTGKTHLAIAIAKHVINNGGRSGFTTVQRIMRRFKECMRKDSEESEKDVIDLVMSLDLLILDEIGVQFGSEYEKNMMFDILNERYEKRLPTILISNLTQNEVKAFIGERVFDRLREDGGICVPFDWQSHRGAQ